MIEFGRLPLFGGVTLGAIGPPCPAVHVIGRMAALRSCWGSAGSDPRCGRHRRPPLCGRRSAQSASAHGESSRAPVRSTVAVPAGLAELTVVHILSLVAGGARGRCRPPGVPRGVAGLAGQAAVSAAQRHIGQLMVKCARIQSYDVRRPTLVFRVTGPAFAGRRVLHPTVIATVVTLVGGNFLVTGEAQGGLRPDIRPVMAIGAGFLQFRVCAADLAGHQQGFHGCPKCDLSADHEAHPGKPPKRSNMEPRRAMHGHRSIDIDRNDMHDACNQQHEEQRNVQDVPEREQLRV